jgi:hypothetical protein
MLLFQSRDSATLSGLPATPGRDLEQKSGYVDEPASGILAAYM